MNVRDPDDGPIALPKKYFHRHLFGRCTGSSTHLFDEVNGRLKVEAEVDERPLDALPPVLLLLEDEHGVVEELLELLVRVVDAQLFEVVHLLRNTSTSRNFNIATLSQH